MSSIPRMGCCWPSCGQAAHDAQGPVRGFFVALRDHFELLSTSEHGMLAMFDARPDTSFASAVVPHHALEKQVAWQQRPLSSSDALHNAEEQNWLVSRSLVS